MDEFTHTPLPRSGRPFRLVRLEPRGSHGPEIVRVSLFESDLNKDPKFTALSYVWGSPPGMAEILVNGSRLKVPINLDKFLRSLRSMCGIQAQPSDGINRPSSQSHWAGSQVNLSSPFIFWADSICINQIDVPEKNQQIPLMKDIYGSSQKTISWVGEETDFSNQAIDHLFSMANNSELPYQKRWTSHPIITNVQAWDALRKFCELQFWNRIWILQEFALPEELVIMCGIRTLNIDELQVAVGTWKNCYWQLVEGGRLPHHVLHCTPDKIEPFVEQRGLYRETQWEGDHSPTRYPDDGDHLRIVIAAGRLDATDPRDKLYGLCGVTSRQLNCDYALTTREVYASYARVQIKDGLGNVIIGYSGVGALDDHERTCDLPSWVPDWNSILKPLPNNKLRVGNFWSQDPWKISFRFSECFRLKDNDPKRLLVKGVRCQLIVKTHRWQSDLAQDWDFWTCWPIHITDRYPYHIPQLQAVLRTLLMYDEWWTVHFPDLSYRFALAFILILQRMPSLRRDKQAWTPDALETLYDIENILRNLTWDQPGEREAYVSLLLIGTGRWGKPRRVLPKSPEGDERLIKEFLEEIAVNIGHRSFFWTEDGYFGIGPRGCRPDDQLFFSTEGEHHNFCFLVRKVGDHFLNVGPAYVFGHKMPEFVDVLEDPTCIEEIEIG